MKLMTSNSNTDRLPKGFQLLEESVPDATAVAEEKEVSLLLELLTPSSTCATETRAHFAASCRSAAVQLYLEYPNLRESDSLSDPVIRLLEKAHSLKMSLDS